MVFKKQITFLLPTIVIALLINIADAGPIVFEDIDFKDSWEYKIQPHNEPLLGRTSRNHILPPIGKRQGKEPDLEDELVPILKNISAQLGDSVRKRISCPVCKIGAGLLQGEVKKGTSVEGIKEKFVSICVGFNVATEPVCTGAFDVFGPDMLAVLRVIQLGPKEICSMILGEVCEDVDNPLHDWDVVFPDVQKPEVKVFEPVQPDTPNFKVLHLSDTHLDPDYEVGSVANCKEPLCCRSYSSPPDTDKIVPAGRWGSYGKCDSPKILIDNMLKNIAEEHPDIDYIIWTGDLPPHDIWNQTKKESIEILKETVQQMFNIFPDTPIFPALGNHEGIPAGSFPPPWANKYEDHSITWLYNEVASQWTKWLPPTANNTLLHGGFYSVLIRPAFRLISLNMNYCHTLSWWLLVNSTDPAKELQWLIYELQEAENNGEKVHIIGHIPPGDSDCMKVWSKNYYAIVNRYENTIAAQFFGHSHADEFEIFYDDAEFKRPTSIAYVGPSVTTYENFNPGYRIYYVDGDHDESTREVIDHETWIIDLDKANNSTEDPTYFKLYSAREAYGMSTLRPKEWDTLVKKMTIKPKMFDLFYRYYFKDSPVRPDCDKTCKLQILCDLKSGRSHDRHHLCHDLEQILS